MSHITESTLTAGGRSWPILQLELGDTARAAVAPALGANLFRWQTRAGLAWTDWLDTPPPAEWVERPTRGGVPVLFPFPNRVRGGRFRSHGRDFQLPLTDVAGGNAIHGFACRAAWTVRDRIVTDEAVRVELEYRASRDVLDWQNLWPADQTLTVAWELRKDSLTATMTASNPDPRPLPFGLGLHPYFLADPDDWLTVFAERRWNLVNHLPDGRILNLDRAYDLRSPRPLKELTLDDVYTHVRITSDQFGMRPLGQLVRRGAGRILTVRASDDFREVVVFTPPHRRSVCVEPYTCPTDAVNHESPDKVGWRTLPPGQRWTGRVAFELAQLPG